MSEKANAAYRARLQALINIPTGASQQDIGQMIEEELQALQIRSLPSEDEAKA